MKLNKKFWKNKKIFITGHTGFKGGWLSIILNHLNCKISGYALNPIGKKNFFYQVGLKNLLKNDLRNDICNISNLRKSIKRIRPEIIFHLAAQSTVVESYKNPIQTILTNTLGTANLLQASRDFSFIKCIVIVTTDKVYQNYKLIKKFDENSKLGGDDIYSGSKASCEILVNSFKNSFFKEKNCKIATVRAGNCFGGGDWTPNRIVKDSLENFYNNKTLILRNPNATRPWQHVLEPLIGYLLLVEKLISKGGKKYEGPWNFGPSVKQNLKVFNLANIIKKKMKSKSKIIVKTKFNEIKKEKIKIIESKNLNISNKKAKIYLKWQPKLTVKNSLDLTIAWYNAYKDKKNLLDLTRNQIKGYLKKL